MKRFVYYPSVEIPDERVADCQELMKYILNYMHISITLRDTYLLWKDISESWSASWLHIETHYEDMTRDEFLRSEMAKRGYFIEV